jgi:hypothetical protein
MDGEGQLIMSVLGCTTAAQVKSPRQLVAGALYCLTQFKPLGPLLRLFEDGDEVTSLQQDNSRSSLNRCPSQGALRA